MLNDKNLANVQQERQKPQKPQLVNMLSGQKRMRYDDNDEIRDDIYFETNNEYDEYGDDENDSDIDENSREIDYPEDEDDEEDQNDDDDNEQNENDNYNEQNENDEPLLFSKKPVYASSTQYLTCSVCCSEHPRTMWQWNTLDHYMIENISNAIVLQNPCQKHAVCVGCMRKALRHNLHNMLNDGNGHIPCLGDSECCMTNRQRTTVYFNVFSELFSPDEFVALDAQRSRWLNTRRLKEPHSFVTPLVDRHEMTFSHVVNHIKALLMSTATAARTDNNNFDIVIRPLCPVCGIMLEKTAACNALRHCDYEVCWMCGCVERRLSADHWKTCARFDSLFGKQTPQYLCEEGKCFTEKTCCNLASHKDGLRALQEHRKQKFLSSLWTSLSAEHQNLLRQHEPHLYSLFCK